MKKSILFKKLGIILLISQTLVGVPMLAQESILETTVQTDGISNNRNQSDCS